jgi:hypothetical protein
LGIIRQKTLIINIQYKIKEILKMGKFNLADAAKAIMQNLQEDSKSTFDANIASKKAQRGGEKAPHGEVGKDRLQSKTAYGTNDAGEIGQSPERGLVDSLPDYTKGTPSATPPGATPPVGSEKDGVGISKPQGQPQETMGRHDLTNPAKVDATSYEAIRDRIAGKLAPQMMTPNAGAHFQQYEETESEEDVIAEEELTRKKAMHEQLKEKMKEDIDALLQGENLSEEFVTKASTIFEAAVIARAEEVIEESQNELMEQFEVAIEVYKEELATKVDEYLNYMVEEWLRENEIAIEKGLRAEIAEGFMNSLRDLFVEHYIDVPTEKVDIAEELANKCEQLEAELNEQINKTIDLTKQVNEQRKIEAIYAVCEGLTQTQVEKLKSLAESVEFTTEEEFVGKLDILKESYFKPSDVKVADQSSLEEVLVEEDTSKKKTVSDDPSMDVYAKAISQSLAK